MPSASPRLVPGSLSTRSNLGAQVGQQHAQKRNRTDGRQFDDPHSVQRSRHVVLLRSGPGQRESVVSPASLVVT